MDFSLENYKRPQLETPNGERHVLLHICCAVCAGEILEALQASGLHTTAFFYNPNVHPVAEYEKRKAENRRFVDKLGVRCIDGDYDSERWFEVIAGHEQDPERGKRCALCFAMRLERAAKEASKHGIPLLATTLGISRWKDLQMVNHAGTEAVRYYDGLSFWDFNWRKKGGSQRMSEIAQREEFYRQDYCGCRFSKEASQALKQESSADA